MTVDNYERNSFRGIYGSSARLDIQMNIILELVETLNAGPLQVQHDT